MTAVNKPAPCAPSAAQTAHSKDSNLLSNSPLKMLLGGMVNFRDVKIPVFVARKDQICSEPQPSSLFHTFKFKGNRVFHWKKQPRSCNKADTETSISADVELWKLPEGKHSYPAKPPPNVRTASEKQVLRLREQGRGPGEGTFLHLSSG